MLQKMRRGQNERERYFALRSRRQELEANRARHMGTAADEQTTGAKTKTTLRARRASALALTLEIEEIEDEMAHLARAIIEREKEEAEEQLARALAREQEAASIVSEHERALAAAVGSLRSARGMRTCSKAECERAARSAQIVERAIEEGQDPLAKLDVTREREARASRQKRITAVQQGELDVSELTDLERAEYEQILRWRAEERAERERISAEAGTLPKRLDDLDGPHVVKPGQMFPRLPNP